MEFWCHGRYGGKERGVRRASPHQNGPEDGRADAVGHLELSLFVGTCEVVVPPRPEHPKNNQSNRHASAPESVLQITNCAFER